MEECKMVKQNSLQDVMNENLNLILECLDISTIIRNNLTSDSVEISGNPEITCMMAQAGCQNNKLKDLLENLQYIKTNMFN